MALTLYHSYRHESHYLGCNPKGMRYIGYGIDILVGLRRLFDPGVLERLALIGLGRAAGFSLDEIARMFGAGGEPAIDRRMLAAKADELDMTIRKLGAMRDGLRHAAACPAPSHMECPKFRRIMSAVASGARTRRLTRKRHPAPQLEATRERPKTLSGKK
jgi:DNA-binding transcriptional MerR regulator